VLTIDFIRSGNFCVGAISAKTMTLCFQSTSADIWFDCGSWEVPWV